MPQVSPLSWTVLAHILGLPWINNARLLWRWQQGVKPWLTGEWKGCIYVCLRVIQSMHVCVCDACVCVCGCGVFSGCSWTGCIIDVLLALPGSCSLIRVCQGINRLKKANQGNREKARSISLIRIPPSPLRPLAETSHHFKGKTHYLHMRHLAGSDAVGLLISFDCI